MANTLTNQFVEIYTALDMVAREPYGMIQSVFKNSSAEMLSANTTQTVRYPITPAASAVSITESMTLPSGANQSIGSGTMKVNNRKAVQIPWNGEEQLGLRTTGTLNTILVDQYFQAFRALGNLIEADLCGKYASASRAYGVCGVTPFASDMKAINACRKIVRDNGSPDAKLKCVFDTSAGLNAMNLTQMIASGHGDTMDNSQFRSGKFQPVYNTRIYESGQIQTVTSGNASTSLAATEAVASTALTVDSESGFTVGDIVNIGTATDRYVAASTASGTININAPGVITAAATNANVTSAATNYTANMFFHEDAIHLVTRVPAMPAGGDASVAREIVTDPVSGLSFQLAVYQGHHMNVTEVSIVWGAKVVKSDFMALLLG